MRRFTGNDDRVARQSLREHHHLSVLHNQIVLVCLSWNQTASCEPVIYILQINIKTCLRRKRRFWHRHRRHRCRGCGKRNSQYPYNWLPIPLGWSDKGMRTIGHDSQTHLRRRKVVCPQLRFDLPAHSSGWFPKMSCLVFHFYIFLWNVIRLT